MYMHALRNRNTGHWDLYRDGTLIVENCAESYALELMNAELVEAWWRTVRYR